MVAPLLTTSVSTRTAPTRDHDPDADEKSHQPYLAHQHVAPGTRSHQRVAEPLDTM